MAYVVRHGRLEFRSASWRKDAPVFRNRPSDPQPQLSQRERQARNRIAREKRMAEAAR